MSLITDSEVDEQYNQTISYRYNGTTAVYEGTIIITAEFRESIGDNYALFIADDGTPLLYQTGYSCLVFGSYGANSTHTPSFFVRCNSDFTSPSLLKGFYYDSSTNEWLDNSSTSLSKRVTPNSFLFSSGLSVFVCDYIGTTSTSASTVLDNMLKNGIVDCVSAKFDIKDPYLVSFNDNVLTFALKTFYPGYSWSSDIVTEGIYSTELSSYDDFYLYLYNAYDSTNSITLNYTSLKNYIIDVEDIGKCIQIDLTKINGFDFKNSDYFYEFGFVGTYKSSVYYTTSSNTTTSGSYNSYYSFLIEDGLTYGVDIGGGTTGGGSSSDDNNTDSELTNSINEQTNSINNLTNTITSNEYDESQIQIDSSLSNDVDEESYTNFITEIINSINNAITCDWNKVEKVEIPLGFVDKNITWTSDLLSAHVPEPLKIIINTFWMFLFGFYIFKFSLNLVNWLKSGEILDGKGFNSDEVITSNML